MNAYELPQAGSLWCIKTMHYLRCYINSVNNYLVFYQPVNSRMELNLPIDEWHERMRPCEEYEVFHQTGGRF
jgi:hypothetical protein